MSDAPDPKATSPDSTSASPDRGCEKGFSHQREDGGCEKGFSHQQENAFSHQQDRSPGGASDTGTLGMRLFLLSLGILFAATISGYLVTRARAEVWPPPGMPGLPAGLWVSTALIVLISAAAQWGLAGIRRNRHGRLIGAMLITGLMGVAFLASQAVNWAWLIGVHATVSTGMYMFLFYMLTGLHGLHVIGGLIMQIVVTARSFAGRYSADYHPGVKYAATYWHFLDAVWIVMFVVMFLV